MVSFGDLLLKIVNSCSVVRRERRFMKYSKETLQKKFSSVKASLEIEGLKVGRVGRATVNQYAALDLCFNNCPLTKKNNPPLSL